MEERAIQGSVETPRKRPIKWINSWGITSDKSTFGNPGDIVYIYNDENGTRRKGKIEAYGETDWYFYIKKTKKGEKVLDSIAKDKINFPSFLKNVIGKDWIRIYCSKIDYKDTGANDVIKHLEAKGVETYEAEIGLSKRYCLDNEIIIEDWDKIRVLYFDIETDDSSGSIEYIEKNGRNVLNTKDRILSFAAIDRAGKEYFFGSSPRETKEKQDAEEKLLLGKINTFLRDHDMLIGWNSKGFDKVYLLDRMKKYKLPTDYLYNMLHEDMMRRIQYFYLKDPVARQEISSYSLEFCSNYFLGKGKTKINSKINELWRNNPDLLKKYNLQDAKLLRDMEEELGIMRLTYSMFQWCRVFARDWSVVKTIDNFILSYANTKGVHYRTNLAYIREDTEEEVPSQYLGAFVITPEPGLYKNVYVLDFRSLYPNIIRTFNISPEGITDVEKNSVLTPGIKNEDGELIGKMRFKRRPAGVIPYKISKLLDERDEIKKKMKGIDPESDEYRDLNVKQLVVKELANSIYGVLGNKWFRSFSTDMAESITATGQYLIKYIQKHFNKNGRKVLYGDTDSVFMTIKEHETPEDVARKINRMLRFHLEKYGIKKSFIEIQLDKTFDKFLIETKKKYAGIQDGKIKYVGMECVKRDTIPAAALAQRKLVELVFSEPTSKKMHDWVKAVKKRVMESTDFKVEDLTIRKKLAKEPKEYKSVQDGKTPPVHVRIAQDLSKKGKGDKGTHISVGSIIPYIITKGTGMKIEKAVHADEFDGEWDRNYYWDKIIWPMLERVLEVAYPKEDWKSYRTKPPKKKTSKESKKASSKK